MAIAAGQKRWKYEIPGLGLFGETFDSGDQLVPAVEDSVRWLP